MKTNDLILKKTPLWKRTNDLEGHKPKFNLECKICGTPMALRHSTIVRNETDEEKRGFEFNYMCYKCPACAWFIRFDVRDDKEYLFKVLDEYRGGNKMLVPTVDDWSDDSDEIKQRLKDLGYW